MAGSYVYRVHPAIGIARVGSGDEYRSSPETTAGLPQWDQAESGGLPIDPETGLPIKTDANGKNFRDNELKLKRQAARFRIHQYPAERSKGAPEWPTGEGTEIRIGSVVEGWGRRFRLRPPRTGFIQVSLNRS